VCISLGWNKYIIGTQMNPFLPFGPRHMWAPITHLFRTPDAANLRLCYRRHWFCPQLAGCIFSSVKSRPKQTLTWHSISTQFIKGTPLGGTCSPCFSDLIVVSALPFWWVFKGEMQPRVGQLVKVSDINVSVLFILLVRSNIVLQFNASRRTEKTRIYSTDLW